MGPGGTGPPNVGQASQMFWFQQQQYAFLKSIGYFCTVMKSTLVSVSASAMMRLLTKSQHFLNPAILLFVTFLPALFSILQKLVTSLQPTLLATLVLFSTNTLPSRIKSLHFLCLATITFVNFAVSARTLTSKQPAPLPPP